jgi:hypothetical protein
MADAVVGAVGLVRAKQADEPQASDWPEGKGPGAESRQDTTRRRQFGPGEEAGAGRAARHPLRPSDTVAAVAGAAGAGRSRRHDLAAGIAVMLEFQALWQVTQGAEIARRD